MGRVAAELLDPILSWLIAGDLATAKREVSKMRNEEDNQYVVAQLPKIGPILARSKDMLASQEAAARTLLHSLNRQVGVDQDVSNTNDTLNNIERRKGVLDKVEQFFLQNMNVT